MDQRRRSAHNAKVSLKLKELMQNKTVQKNTEVIPRRPPVVSKTPLQSVINKPMAPPPHEPRQLFQMRPARVAQGYNTNDNKENRTKASNIHSRKSSMDVTLAHDKSNNSFQKPSSQKSHNRILSMHEHRSVVQDQIQDSSMKSRNGTNTFKSPCPRDLRHLKQTSSRTDLSVLTDKSGLLSTKKKVLVLQKEVSLSRKSSLTSCITKQTVDSVTKALKKASETREQESATFHPTFTFQHIDLSCVDERLDSDQIHGNNLKNFYAENLDRGADKRSRNSSSRQAAVQRDKQQEPFLAPSARYLSKFANADTSISLPMRAVLLNWIAEVTELFMLKREVYHSAVSYLDRYLDATDLRIEKCKFQLLGLVCLNLASKYEESKYRSIDDFLDLAKNIYTRSDMCSLELKVLNALKFKLLGRSLIEVADLMSFNWDNFIEMNNIQKKKCLFRQPYKDSYHNYCKLSQLIDILLYDPEHYAFNPYLLAASCMYVVLAEADGCFDKADISHIFPNRSCYLLDSDIELNCLFSKFLEYYNEMQLEELLPAVQFAAKYYCLPFSFESPSVLKANIGTILNSSIDELLAYFKVNFDAMQTYLSVHNFHLSE